MNYNILKQQQIPSLVKKFTEVTDVLEGFTRQSKLFQIHQRKWNLVAADKNAVVKVDHSKITIKSPITGQLESLNLGEGCNHVCLFLSDFQKKMKFFDNTWMSLQDFQIVMEGEGTKEELVEWFNEL